ncbi:MAG: VPDSG-CTERM sorting domain-containing protein [Verrucomicrobiota bacterium]|nr:VPDSG-CTERM sorting domain-containing protein [Verrucomicrobiota bacterium]
MLAALSLALSSVASSAASYSFTPSPNDLYDLDHHAAFAWRIDNINLSGVPIQSASLTFTNIRNWDNSPNFLFTHLLDTAKAAGVSWFIDSWDTVVSGSDIADNFAGSLFASNPLVTATTGNTFLASPSFSMTGTDFTITFSAAQIAILQNYISHGNDIAFGLDPDCHYYNDGIRFTITTGSTAAVPDSGSTALLLALALPAFAVLRRRLAV